METERKTETEWLTVRDVAALLGVEDGAVRRLLHAKEGTLPGVYLGNRSGWRVRREALEAWLQAKEGQAQP